MSYCPYIHCYKMDNKINSIINKNAYFKKKYRYKYLFRNLKNDDNTNINILFKLKGKHLRSYHFRLGYIIKNKKKFKLYLDEIMYNCNKSI